MKNNNASRGVGFTGLLLIAFIVLKLTHVIEWSWVWVLAPLWVPLALYFVGMMIFILCTWIKRLWKQRYCIFNRHHYVLKWESERGPYGLIDRQVERCTKCGKIKPEKKI